MGVKCESNLLYIQSNAWPKDAASDVTTCDTSWGQSAQEVMS